MARAGLVYVGTTNGLVIYSDPGGTGRWRRVAHVLDGQAIDAMLAVDALVVMVVTHDGKALRTLDGGEHWAEAPADDAETLLALVHSDETVVATAQGPARWRDARFVATDTRALALLSGKQEVLLAATAGGTRLVRSEDGGASWESAEVACPLAGGVCTIAPASYHMDVAWAGTDGGQLLCSDDRGRHWHEVTQEDAGVLSLAVVRLI
ncbi:WD40/YVTN/BNR-like repeat-containing protein [Candidatus Chloroploca asiatica]|uniref:Photosynthesis system II assembly factor Ycf48/Hcf136-like domain-containing protein n=1 Tax=Candidatus Chloroploca asiatica TaxID=1506545 RepID=A0A2H3KK69_9CHLR|nr:hypothetical protein [Candidatus Chloroploca asiatica]PDV98327.1 hypothetical protein A9Q02_16130 [Candidatus Chloroploca asiatica]